MRQITRSTRVFLMCGNLRSGFFMSKAGLFMELVGTYRHHGWELRTALLQPATRAEIESTEAELLNNINARDSEIDALWFSRPSHNNRDAWELRLLAQTPYALFETFEPEETEEERDEVRQEMEARMREYAAKK